MAKMTAAIEVKAQPCKIQEFYQGVNEYVFRRQAV